MILSRWLNGETEDLTALMALINEKIMSVGNVGTRRIAVTHPSSFLLKCQFLMQEPRRSIRAETSAIFGEFSRPPSYLF